MGVTPLNTNLIQEGDTIQISDAEDVTQVVSNETAMEMAKKGETISNIMII
jgi:hypothetical protein